ncbi:hypothetical protein G7046_g7834 [Stylonectria norvegica]|nr:hypothetical protein G7046_g7834 [Stylonectria norvegica]
MRERITFIHRPGDGVDTESEESLQILDEGLLGPRINTTQEARLTVALDELPQDLSDLLRGFAELHIKWASPVEFETLDPFSARISPGFHLSYSPLKGHTSDPSELCTYLQDLFGPLQCASSEAFTASKRGESSATPAFYFYQELENLRELVSATRLRDFCSESDSYCHSRFRSLQIAASFDLSFNATSDTLQATAFFPLRPQRVAVLASTDRRVEVGIFVKDVPATIEPHELGVAGLLAVLGEQKEPSPAMFTFPSRHRQSDSDFTSKFLAPTGLHPTLQLNISSSQVPSEDGECAPYAYLTLPKTIFADQYQLADELFLASKNLSALLYTTLPVDLEAPAYTTKTWGSNVLLQLAPPSADEDQQWTAEVPLHLRYLAPSITGEVKTEIPYLAVFWACSSGNQMLDNPFDRAQLGYDELFDSDTIFWHITPTASSGDRLMMPITVPVLNDGGASWIGVGTAVAVALGFTWVLWKLAAVMSKSGNQTTGTTSKNVQVKKKN